MSSLANAKKKLDGSWQALRRQWQASRGLWNDPVSHRFERDFWQEFERIVPATLIQLESVILVISEARRNVK
jgi:hypothetical protein